VLSAEQRLANFDDRCRALNEFGGSLLLPGTYGGMALVALEDQLTGILGDDAGRHLARDLVAGLDDESSVEREALLLKATQSPADLAAFVERFGHRAIHEMELATPRWREDGTSVRQLVKLAAGSAQEHTHHRREEAVHVRQKATAALPARMAEWGATSLLPEVLRDLQLACELLPYRELGKDLLMRGYELIRQAAVKIAERASINDDIWFVRREELPLLDSKSPEQWRRVVRERRRQWQLSRRVALPAVIDFTTSIEAVPDPPPRPTETCHEAISLSSGTARGTALLIPAGELPSGIPPGCVLVCAALDPALTALLIAAEALVVERGGALSHAAVVARQLGVPAVVVPDACRLFPEATPLLVDADRGQVRVESAEK
jgi:rifampicin phosphotransferase